MNLTPQFIIDACYFAAAFLFIYGLKRMSSPVTARSGIMVAGIGMLVAVLASFLYYFGVNDAALPHLGTNVVFAAVALFLGTAWAWWSGKRVAMTAMPQMVALYNGMGGGAAACIAAVELLRTNAVHQTIPLLLAVVGALIGAVSLSGSLIAWAKLDGRINGVWRIGGQQILNGIVFLATLGVGIYIVFVAHGHAAPGIVAAFFIGALIFGVMMTMPIGGADMPVVISLYNAFTGLAVGFEGYVLQNPALMIAGMVVGSAGTLLTLLMAKAMNRSVSNVIFSNFGDGGGEQQGEIKGSQKPAEAGDAAINMRYASKVIIAPGYGLAVAQAQHKLYEFVKLLTDAGVEVKFAIHPVAGRMPGHMNVLLAEAGVPYDMIYDLEDINGEFKEADVAVVIGANDTVNPAARTNKSSPIYGMPILNVDQARQVYVIKRGQGKGYSGVENELFFADNCNLVYGDAQKVMVAMIQAVKSLEGGGH
ncbi:NAD(P)(+) transhydrogenase (Re/Si-specific) subunit beta [Steroidobacter agaridevorans]|uniref:NAD(P)(+) transhydrogenase (Re/Si-specific) subunit beta n=1 Tax=Steroidobacter agaridevorans TaxID=2695856 RepID=UPI00132B4433|nr:NAD(P)(+) transhydrogenase (Re/Si-specific) subunit beta [Steroidobacter agaridevorans]GFE89342.1 NAD(P) transhydrogenase subunit beta [Steroidobacter agaridevorans]